MFNCGKCKTTSKPGVSAVKVVVETRPKVYYDKDKVVGEGFEIVKEIMVCRECVE